MSSLLNTHPSITNQIKPFLPNENNMTRKAVYGALGGTIINALTGTDGSVAPYVIASLASEALVPLLTAINRKTICALMLKDFVNSSASLPETSIGNMRFNPSFIAASTMLKNHNFICHLAWTTLICNGLNYKMNGYETVLAGFIVPSGAALLHKGVQLTLETLDQKVDACLIAFAARLSPKGTEVSEINLTVAEETTEIEAGSEKEDFFSGAIPSDAIPLIPAHMIKLINETLKEQSKIAPATDNAETIAKSAQIAVEPSEEQEVQADVVPVSASEESVVMATT